MRARHCLAFGLLLLGCSGGGGTPGDLSGTWTATRLEFVSTATPATRVEIVAAGGHATLVLGADTTYTATVSVPGEPVETTRGTWSASADVLTLTMSDRSGVQQFDYVLSGATLTLSGADGEFDFDADGAMEPAKVSLTATRG